MAEEFELQLESGRVRGQRFGAPDGPLVLCIHGLSAHMHGFDFLADRLVNSERQLVALDLRGRGRSDVTPPGTYGIDAHVRDVLEAATLLKAESFDLVGWSMGALIGIKIASVAPSRLRRLALIDHAGRMDEASVALVDAALARLDAVVATPEEYVEAIRAAGAISPWTKFWDRFYRYELGPHGDGLRPTTSRTACSEDLADFERHDWHELWRTIDMPALLVRCLTPLGGGFIVPEHERDALQHAVPQLTLAEVESNHYTVMTDERAASAIGELLDPP